MRSRAHLFKSKMSLEKIDEASRAADHHIENLKQALLKPKPKPWTLEWFIEKLRL